MSAGSRGLATSAMPLVAVEPGKGSERAAFQLDHWNAESGGVDDQLIECGSAFRHDE